MANWNLDRPLLHTVFWLFLSLSTLSDLKRVSFIAGKATSYVQNASIEYAHVLCLLRLWRECMNAARSQVVQKKGFLKFHS